MSTQEIRQNKATRQWVVFSPARNQKPKEFEESCAASEEEAPAHDDACPFCPGNQDFSSDLLFEHTDSASGRQQTRAIINKFPALAPEGSLAGTRSPAVLRRTGALRLGHPPPADLSGRISDGVGDLHQSVISRRGCGYIECIR